MKDTSTEGNEEGGAELLFLIHLESREKIRWPLESFRRPDSSLRASPGASPNHNLRQAGGHWVGVPSADISMNCMGVARDEGVERDVSVTEIGVIVHEVREEVARRDE